MPGMGTFLCGYQVEEGDAIILNGEEITVRGILLDSPERIEIQYVSEMGDIEEGVLDPDKEYEQWGY
jgi:non-homologous end joining protein Ku